ncbi:vWA domain-containing protein [Actinomycetospora callitridis]|uniref:vWA domain-containing protein n=1 Tax=Actinomycetospora callitridis TaxID=913944 RepID=UPI00236519BD|nr:VWA domain-containing protein [Actinomycetospora callitridis]MDD7918383.1 VWA domain-containing protein [Actinomycetospora callitridis]
MAADPNPSGGPEGGPGGGPRSGRYSYGRFYDGPDPLAPPFDLRSAMDELGRDVMEGTSPRQAMRELMRRGLGDQQGLDDLMRRLNERRSKLQREHRLDGTLQEVRELLERALEAERNSLQAEDSDDARFREMQLDALPPSPAGAVAELQDYDWRNAEARQAYEQIQDLLGREALDQRFQGMKQAMENATPEDVERVREMISDLNDLLEAHGRGEDTAEQFGEFMAKHGEFFPENPQTTDELIDLLAERAAAAQRMMNSLSAEQRAELEGLMQQAFGDPRLAEQLSRLDQQLQGMRPGEDWQGRGRFRGDDPMGMGEATRAMEELGQMDALAEQLSQSYPGARMEDIDLEALEATLGEQARVDAQRLAELQRELEEQGVFQRAADGSLMLSPKALRQLGQSSLRDVVGSLSTRRGERETQRSGAAGEATGATRPWSFGDTERWDVSRTLLNAEMRKAGGDVRDLDVSDVEIVETEQRTRAAVALCVDTSWSMVADGRWVPMKRTALALHHLVSTRFRGDALQLITFGRHAKEVELGELTALEGAWEQGTNLHHALLLAGRHLRKNIDAAPVVLVVTDGEPTAHLEPDGHAAFDYPPSPETLRATLNEVDALARLHAAMTVFMLGEDPRLEAFVDLVARRAGGRVVNPDLDGLGAAVVSDYLASRRRR